MGFMSCMRVPVTGAGAYRFPAAGFGMAMCRGAGVTVLCFRVGVFELVVVVVFVVIVVVVALLLDFFVCGSTFTDGAGIVGGGVILSGFEELIVVGTFVSFSFSSLLVVWSSFLLLCAT